MQINTLKSRKAKGIPGVTQQGRGRVELRTNADLPALPLHLDFLLLSGREYLAAPTLPDPPPSMVNARMSCVPPVSSDESSAHMKPQSPLLPFATWTLRLCRLSCSA